MEINKEVQASQYYLKNSYVPTYYYAYIVIEEWLAKNVFRNDLTRVFLASNEYAFRRRFELTDMSEDFTSTDVSSLQFPFANYCPQNNGWVPDDTVAAKQAAMIYRGIYCGSTLVKAAASKMEIPVTLYFDREDDARFAYDTLYFFTFNKHYYSTSIPYGVYGRYSDGSGVDSAETIDIPVNLSIPRLTFNPDFNEKDWLTQNRIFTISMTFEVKSFAIKPPEQPKEGEYISQTGYLVDKDGNYIRDEKGNSIKYNDGSEYYYITEDVILNMFSRNGRALTYAANFDEVSGKSRGKSPFPETGEIGTFYIDSDYKVDGEFPLNPPVYIWSNNRYQRLDKNSGIYHSIFDIDISSIRAFGTIERSSIAIDYLRVENIKNTVATLTWKYSDNFNPEDLSSITLTVNNKTYDVPLNATEYGIKGLKAGSKYVASIIFITKDGKSKSLFKEFITLGPQIKENKASESSIIGYKW